MDKLLLHHLNQMGRCEYVINLFIHIVHWFLIDLLTYHSWILRNTRSSIYTTSGTNGLRQHLYNKISFYFENVYNFLIFALTFLFLKVTIFASRFLFWTIYLKLLLKLLFDALMHDTRSDISK